MDTLLKKRFLRIALLSALALGVVAGAMALQNKPAPSSMDQLSKPARLPVAGLKIGGPYTLVDHDGKTVTEKDFSGTHKLIFFGFTFCPDVCPTELKKISLALDLLGAEAEKIRPLFITVDPERDTPPVMKQYLSLYHPRLTGLTGTVEQIEHIEKIYKVYSMKTENPEYSDYLVDHSSFMYLMGPDDQLLALIKPDDTPEGLVQIVRDVLSGQ